MAKSDDAAPKKTGLPEGFDRESMCAIARPRGKCDMQPAIARGLFETGLRPRFPDRAECHNIDHQFAIDYAQYRGRESYHGGIDIPVSWDTPVVAVAAGTVVAIYPGNATPRGIEIVLQHSPDDTGIPLWIYTAYTHFRSMPKFEIGQRVKMGQYLGPTGNTGISLKTGTQSLKRRSLLHLGVVYSTSKKYFNLRNRVIIPQNAQWMDPNALYRGKLPLDSASMKALPSAEKKVPIPVMFTDGSFYPADTKLIWPYKCKSR